MNILKRAGTYFKPIEEPVKDVALIEAIRQQSIYWSDDRDCHWFFDFEFKGRWISCWRLNNELTECVIDIFTP